MDLYTWSPAIGGGGDNNYNIPGAKKLDGTKDGAASRPVLAGLNSFSATPTIAQINASSDYNQLIAAYNRRALTYNTAFGTTLATAAYVAQGARILASDVINLLAKINLLRTQEGWFTTALVWPFVTPAANGKITGDHLAFLRKSLAISGPMNFPFSGIATARNYSLLVPSPLPRTNAQQPYALFVQDDDPYGTPYQIADNDGSTSLSLVVGKVPIAISGHPSTLQRSRLLLAICVPEWMTSIVSAVLTNRVGSTNTTLEGFTLNVYSTTPGTSLPPTLSPNTANDFNKFHGSNVIGGIGLYTVNIDKPTIIANAGKVMYFILASNLEATGGGLGYGGSGKFSEIFIPIQNSTDNFLRLTF